MLHVLGHGPHETVAEKNAEERPHQGRADRLAKDVGRLADLPHGEDDAEDGGDDPEARQRIGHGGDTFAGRRELLVGSPARRR